MKIIRKISVGRDYPNGSIHYQVGKRMNLLGTEYTISLIVLEEVEDNKMGYNIYIENNEVGTILWKTVVDMPVHIENDITFA
tara:strand:- start:21217 stop:21462 length:246 start_codon:yes stop_codon:yes gene_type:complete